MAYTERNQRPLGSLEQGTHRIGCDRVTGNISAILYCHDTVTCLLVQRCQTDHWVLCVSHHSGINDGIKVIPTP